MSLESTGKALLKKIGLFEQVRRIKKTNEKRKNLTQKYKFEGKVKNKDKVCFILAGYKTFLYDSIFNRIKKYVPNDVEVCILSSGKYCEDLSKIAKSNDWSYISTKRNNVALIQNVAINHFKNAKYIYKLDEDIFVTEGYFETMLKTLNECEKSGEYQVGFIAPTIPINGFGNMLVLKRFELIDTYTELFEKPLYAAGPSRMIESNPDVAKFFWGDKDYLPQLDEMNKIVSEDEFDYVACPIRFSIGAILFKRETWENMGMYKVMDGAGMGVDEQQFCDYCMSTSHAIIVSKNSIVGHLSFGKQNSTMEEYYKNNKNFFDLNK